MRPTSSPRGHTACQAQAHLLVVATAGGPEKLGVALAGSAGFRYSLAPEEALWHTDFAWVNFDSPGRYIEQLHGASPTLKVGHPNSWVGTTFLC